MELSTCPNEGLVLKSWIFCGYEKIVTVIIYECTREHLHGVSVPKSYHTSIWATECKSSKLTNTLRLVSVSSWKAIYSQELGIKSISFSNKYWTCLNCSWKANSNAFTMRYLQQIIQRFLYRVLKITDISIPPPKRILKNWQFQPQGYVKVIIENFYHWCTINHIMPRPNPARSSTFTLVQIIKTNVSTSPGTGLNQEISQVLLRNGHLLNHGFFPASSLI